MGSKGGIISGAARRKLASEPKLVERIVNRWIGDTAKGDNRAREQLLERMEGKVELNINQTIESRYVIEERGVPYVDIAAAPIPAANIGTGAIEQGKNATSDNTRYDAHSANETKAGQLLPNRIEPECTPAPLAFNDAIAPPPAQSLSEAERLYREAAARYDAEREKRRGGADPHARGTEGPTGGGPAPVSAPGSNG